MKQIAKVMTIAALALTLSVGAQAQFRQSVFFNANLPVGGFASNVGDHLLLPLGYTEIGKDASFGFGLGYRASYRFDVGVGMVAPFAQADFFWNTISASLSEEYTQARSKSTPTYFNIPVQLGVSYLYDELPWSDITAFAEFGIGADMLFITPEGPCTYTTAGVSATTLKLAYKPTTAIAFSIGAGAYFGRHVSAGIYYYGLGKHNIEYTSSTFDKLDAASQLAYNSGDVQTRTVGSLALRIGFHF